jgi:hypothetical protein
MEIKGDFLYDIFMSQISNELLYDVLKKVQSDLTAVKQTLADHTHHLLRLREDVNNLRVDDLRRENLQAQMDVRLERIEARLNLSDA